MKILLLSEYYPYLDSEITGGVENRAYNISKRLAKNNQIDVITSWQKGQKRKYKLNGVIVHRVGSHHNYSNAAGFLSRARFAYAAYKYGLKLNPDIVDGYNYTTYAPSYHISKKLDVPVIATYHETWIGQWVKNKGVITGLPYEIYERLLLNLKFDKIISVSNFTKIKLQEQGLNNINVIPNGVDVRKLQKITSKKFKQPTICFVGRLVRSKNVEILIKAINHIKKTIPNIKCKIIGKGSEKTKLQNLVKKLNLKQNVEFLGYINNHNKVMKILASSTVFSHPSTVEGFGLVLIEAMALGTPYICTDTEVFNETTKGGVGGLLFKKSDYLDLGEKIKLLIINKKLYSAKVKEQQQLIKEYDWNMITKKIETLYLKIFKYSIH